MLKVTFIVTFFTLNYNYLHRTYLYSMKPIVYNCIIDENEDDETGIFAMSFVDYPANETDFVALKSDKKIFLSHDRAKHILTGVVLRPEQMIYRNDENLGEYYIKFSADQIEKIAQKMMKTGIALQTTTHQHQSPLEGNYLTELWIVEDPQNDKSNALGFSNLPKGTLMCSYKVTPAYWDQHVASGDVKGFSLEGYFRQYKVDLSKIKTANKNVNMAKKRKFNVFQKTALSAVGFTEAQIRKLENETTSSGDDYTVFRLEDGKEVFVDQEGYVTLDGDPLPAGEHKLDDGNILVVDKDNKLVEVKTPDGDSKEVQAPETLRRQLRAYKRKLEESQEKMDDKDEEIKQVEDEIAKLKKALAAKEDELKRVKGELTDVKDENTELKRSTPSSRPANQMMNQSNSKMTFAQRLAVIAQEKQRRNQ